MHQDLFYSMTLGSSDGLREECCGGVILFCCFPGIDPKHWADTGPKIDPNSVCGFIGKTVLQTS